MNLLPTSEQDQILDAAKDFLSGEAPVERLRPQHGQIGNLDHLLWPQLGELGFWGLSLPESLGGSGLTVCDEYLLFREFGRHLISIGALGLTLGARVAGMAGHTDALSAILAGQARVAIANPRGHAVLGPESSGHWHLLEGRDADWVLAWSPAGSALFAADQFSAVEDVLAMDSHMTLQRAELDAVPPVAFLPAAVEDLDSSALALIAAYGVGVAEATRDMAVDYAKVREQFGQPIGSFQAVKHRCADMAIRTEVAYCQATYAALALALGHKDRKLHVVAAKLLATDAALKNSADNIQTHGAFGFTAEGDAHLYLKRAHTLDFLSGDLRAQKAALLRQPSPYEYAASSN
jgi:alkylation response protein AidB-like acyl-CoA dehydrogenase